MQIIFAILIFLSLLLFLILIKLHRYIRRITFLQNLFGSHVLVVYTLYPENRMVSISGNSYELFGYHLIEFKKKRIAIEDMIYKDDWPVFEFMLKYPELSNRKLVLRMNTKDGRIVWTEHIYRGVKNIAGKVICVEGVIKNINEEKNNEMILRESEEKFRELFDNATDMMFLLQFNSTSDTYKIIELNNVALAKIVYNSDQVVGTNFERLVKTDYIQLFHDRMRTTLEKGYSTFEMVINSNDGSVSLLDTNTSYFRLNNEKTILLVCRDITEKKKIENELEKSQRLESLGLLAGGLAHDFNNLLTAVLGNVSLVRITLSESESRIGETLLETENVLIKARELTHQLLSFSKGFSLIKVKGDLVKLIEKNALFIARGTGVKCEIKLERNCFIAEFDEGQVVQVINNLVINASQAMKSGGILKITGEIIKLSENNELKLFGGDYGVFHFKDNGSGIRNEDIQKIFDPFYTTKAKGTGLGLSSVYSIMKKHNGKITVESELGKGACFNLYFPLLSDEERKEFGMKKNNTDKIEIYKNTGKILIMDDNEDIIKMAEAMITYLGYEVHSALNGESAIMLYQKEIMNNTPFDIVILDMTIQGGMGGVETLKKLKEIDHNVKAVVSSGYADSDVMTDFKNAGFSGCVSKPYTVETLSETLNSLMHK